MVEVVKTLEKTVDKLALVVEELTAQVADMPCAVHAEKIDNASKNSKWALWLMALVVLGFLGTLVAYALAHKG